MRAIKAFACARTAGMLIAEVAAISPTFACDLLPVTFSFAGKFPVGSQYVDTDTRVTLTFKPNTLGKYEVQRKMDTFLLLIGEKISGQIDAIEPTLPKNDCNAYARISSRDARVTPPTFVVNASIDGSFWACTPVVKVPCFLLPMLNNSLPQVQDSQDVEIDEGSHSPAILPTQVGFKFPGLSIPQIPNPLPGIIPIPNPLPIPHGIPVPMCDGPRIKTKLGSGRTSMKIELAGAINDNKAEVIVKSAIDSKLDTQTQFLLGIIGGAGFAWLAKDPLEKQLSSIVAQQITWVPDKVPLPEAPHGVLEFKTTHVQFNAEKYSDNILPAFEVTQNYHNAKKSISCAYRKQVVEHLP